MGHLAATSTLTGRDVLFTPLHQPLIIRQSMANARTSHNAPMKTSKPASQPTRRNNNSSSVLPKAWSTDRQKGWMNYGNWRAHRDTYLLYMSRPLQPGLLYPDKFGVAYKHYRMTGNLHGMISHLKRKWHQLLHLHPAIVIGRPHRAFS
ncbi:MAG: hypothetical protein HS120_10265 [Burkholderiales bacterium]|nr:hypothetical protein [Burkholderiales bacterium]